MSTEPKTADELVDTNRAPHINEAGEEIDASCTSTVTDRICVKCDNKIKAEHSNKVENTVSATCTEHGYTAWKCLDCGEFGKTADAVIQVPTGHDYQWDTVNAPTMYNTGLEEYRCQNSCGELHPITEDVPENTRVIPALGGIEFIYELDNAKKSGADYVNGGQIKLTIKIKAANQDLANILLRLDYDKTVLSYNEEKSEFVCGLKDSDGYDIFELDNVAMSGKTEGMVVINASTTGFGEEPENKNLDGESVFAVIYFDVNKSASADTKINILIGEDGNSASAALKADGSQVNVNFNNKDAATGDAKPIVDEEIVARGDIALNDGLYTIADLVQFLNIASSADEYVAAADIDQDGFIDPDDYMLLKNVILGEITLDQMKDAAGK